MSEMTKGERRGGGDGGRVGALGGHPPHCAQIIAQRLSSCDHLAHVKVKGKDGLAEWNHESPHPGRLCLPSATLPRAHTPLSQYLARCHVFMGSMNIIGVTNNSLSMTEYLWAGPVFQGIPAGVDAKDYEATSGTF